jgi:hypothetical protein
MQKEKLEKLLGRYLTHRKYGKVYVKDVISAEEDKIAGIIESSGEVKVFILSSNYFDNLADVKFEKKFQEKKPRIHVKKERDLSKFRNNPFLMKIDSQEKSRNKLYSSGIVYDDDDDDDEIEEDQD